MQPDPAVPQPAAPFLSTSGVQYAPNNRRLWGAPKGTLTLTNNIITFIDQSGATLVSIDVANINGIRQTHGFLRIYLPETNYFFAFPGWMGGLGGATGSLIGMAVQYESEKQSGINDWISTLRQLRPDIKTSLINFKTQLVLLVILIIVIPLLLLLPFLFSIH